MDAEFFYNLLKLTSFPEEKITAYVKDYTSLINTAVINIVFEELKNNNRNDLADKFKHVINDGTQLYKSLAFADDTKKTDLNKRFEQILLEINDNLLQNKISARIDKRIEEIDKVMIENVVGALNQNDKTKLQTALNNILNN